MTITAGVTTVCYGAATRHLGMLAAVLGEWETAEAHFEASLDLNLRMRAWPWLAHAKSDYADMLRRRGRPAEAPRAHALAAEALETASQFGLTALRHRLRGTEH